MRLDIAAGVAKQETIIAEGEKAMVPAHLQIQNLLGMYAERIDAADFAAVAELFAHAVITSEGLPRETRGAQEAEALYRNSARVYADDGTLHTKHVITNLIIEVDEEAGTASCRSYVTVFQQTPDLPLQPIYQGRYHDRFECIDGQWRFTRRHMFNDRLGDLRHHLNPEILASLGW